MTAKIDDLTLRIEDLHKNFDSMYDEAIETVPLDNMKLVEALKSQIPMQMQWETLHKTACRYHDVVENEMESIYSEAISGELRDSYKSVSISEAREFAKTDFEYKEYRALLVDIRSLRDEIKGVLEVITSRKYTLNNMSNAIVAGVEDHIL
jgi:hypothetical protein